MSHLHHKISALIDGELTPNARTRALAHARSCGQCRREIAETLEVKRRVNRLAPVEVSADLLDVVGSITTPRVFEADAPGRRPTLMRKVFVGVGSLSAVVVALAYVVGASEPSQAKPVRPAVGEFAAEFADSTGLSPFSDPAVGGLDAEPVAADTSSGLYASRRGSSSESAADVPMTAGAAPPTRSGAGDSPKALLLLRRSAEAPTRTSFIGTRLIRSFTPSGTTTFRVNVEHVPGQGTRFDVLRPDGDVRAESFVADSTASSDVLDGQPIGALLDAYDVSMAGTTTVDGRRATVISAAQGDQVRAQFWIDDETGLLLQRALYADGRLVRWSGYSDLRTSRDRFMLHLPLELQTPTVTALATSVAPALNDKGWTCPAALTDHFRLAFLHQLDPSGGVMHAEYTDGLSTLSVFEERGSLDTSVLGGFRSEIVGGNVLYLKTGLPMVAVWESGGTVFTVVTDAPEQLTGALIDRLPHTPATNPPGVTTRIGHGLSRLASAVSP